MKGRRTPLYSRHLSLGAAFTLFAGWEMPLHYTGGIKEHLAVRGRAGLFDVSHMGRIELVGRGAEALLESLSTRRVAGLEAGKALYTLFCREKGGTVDDLILFRLSEERFFLVANAANREKDLEHLRERAASFEVKLLPRYEEEGILALQGPLAEEALSKFFPEAAALQPMRLLSVGDKKAPLFISRTGYTGSGGFELYGKSAEIASLWDLLLKEGGVLPAGLAARDSLRLEMGYALYGHELSESILPTESVASWAVELGGRSFLGREALAKSSSKRRAYGVVVQAKALARRGDPLFFEGERVGEVTSGGFSPGLKVPIALVLAERPLEGRHPLFVGVRGRELPVQLVKLPFYRGES